MTEPPQQTILTAEEFLSHPDRDLYELVDGRLVEHPGGALSSYFGGQLCCMLMDYCERPFRGWVLPAGTTYQFLPGRPNLVRKPDASFIRIGRLPDERLPEGHAHLAPDLAAEVVCPSDMYCAVEEKVAEYRAGGVRLIWVLVPPTRSILIRRLDGSAAEVREDGELNGEDVIPGFRCRVADLFRLPTPPGQSAAGVGDFSAVYLDL